MNKIMIVAQREIMTRIAKKSFIIFTLLIPFIIAAVMFVPLWLSGAESAESEPVMIVDRTGHYSGVLGGSDQYTFVTEEEYAYMADAAPLFATITIEDDLATNPKAVTIVSDRSVPRSFVQMINYQLTQKVRFDKMVSYQAEQSGRGDSISMQEIDKLESMIQNVETAVEAQTMRVDDNGEALQSSAEVAVVIGLLLIILSYMFIQVYGSMVMQSVLEEKSGRIVEIIVSSIHPYKLLAGKMIGIACVGLLQFVIWAVMFRALLAIATGYSHSDAVTEQSGWVQALADLGSVDLASIAALFLLYFIGGYLMFASMFAAIGASVESQSDAQQLVMPILLILVFAMYAGMYSAENPDGPLAYWCSLIPFTSPMVMMMRIPYGGVPAWEIVLSVVLLYATSAVIVWASGQIYRVGLLLHGKKPTLVEILRRITYK